MDMKRIVSFLLAVLMLFCSAGALAEYEAAPAAVNGWRILDSVQSEDQSGNDHLEVWFATDEQVSSGKIIYSYGGVSLKEEELSTMEGVGYIFVVDNTTYYSSSQEREPKRIVQGAISRMSDWDSVAFIGVTEANLAQTPQFVSKGSWEQSYDAVYGNKGASYTREYTYESISKAVFFAQEMYQKKQAREMVLIIITDGSERSKSKTGEDCKTEIQKLSFTLPVYCLHLAPNQDTGKFIDFVGGLPLSSAKTVTKQNAATIGAECVTPFSNLIYRVKLKLGPDIYDARDETLTISMAGSKKGVSQNAVSLNLDLIPTPTPEPTATPTPTPTPEINPQFVGDQAGNEHDIWELQRILIKLGLMEGEPTGVWDIATAGAVNLYYNLNGITTDRSPARGGMTKERYDEFMKKAENATVILPTPTPSPTPTPEPTPVPTIDPEKGIYIGYDTEDRSAIRSLNRLLKEKYYLTTELIDGSVYVDATQAAVDDFYKDHPELSKPTSGEGITKNAYDVLSKADPKKTPEPTEAPTEDPYPAYIGYDTENINLIAELNQKLLDKYLVANPDRIVLERYNEETNASVERFYKYMEEQGVPAAVVPRPSTGAGITKEAYEELLSLKPLPTATPIPDLKFVYSGESLRSADALNAAKRLTELGYLPETTGEVDEIEFKKAILWFAKRNNLDNHDEYLDNGTFKLLMSDKAKPAEDPPETIAPGAKEPKEQIIEFQEALKRLDYFRDIQDPYKPGVFDEPTQKAYTRYCEVNGISWDGGGVSWENQRKVIVTTDSNPALGLFDNIRTFLTRYQEMFGLKIPIWVLMAAALVIIVAVIVFVIVLMKGKKGSAGGGAGSSTLPMGDLSPLSVQMDAPTDELDNSGISTGLDAPTVDPEGCVLSLMITSPSGLSRDVSYNIQDGEQLIIGRGTAADIVMDTEDMSVSRKHGIFRYSAKTISYEDTSSHYSVLDGEKIHLESRVLKQGSQLQIGKSFIKVQWS